jgi:hypothetical protein
MNTTERKKPSVVISAKGTAKIKGRKNYKESTPVSCSDEVSFIITLSARGDKMIADCLQFHFNNALDKSISHKLKIVLLVI